MCKECDVQNVSPYERSMAHFQVQRELLKLQLLFDGMDGAHPELHRSYVLEKIIRVHDGHPISLYGPLQAKFNEMMTNPHNIICRNCRQRLTGTGMENYDHMEKCPGVIRRNE